MVLVWFPDLAVPATRLETLLLHTTDHCSAPLAPAGVPWLHSPQKPPANPIAVPAHLPLSTKGPDPEAPPTRTRKVRVRYIWDVTGGRAP